MPNAKEVKAKMAQTWTIADHIEELRGKYHLKKKDAEAYQESSKHEIHRNEGVISFLRQNNKSKRIILAQHEHGDGRVIQTVFKEDRKERLSLQRYTASGAIEEMDQKVCEAGKDMNAFGYDREKRERKLQELEQELERMCNLEQKNAEQITDEQVVTQLENRLDKAWIKYDTARIISSKYIDILEKLKEESLSLPAKLDVTEQTLVHQRGELKELQGMEQDSLLARDDAKGDLSLVEQEAYEAKRQRDSELVATRKEVERRRNETEKVEKKVHRISLITDNTDQNAALEKRKQDNQQCILKYKEAVERIKMATQVTDIDDVVERVRDQNRTRDQLRARVQELEAQCSRLKEERGKLMRSFHDMKYTGEKKLSRGEKLLEDMKDHLELEVTRHGRAMDNLKRNAVTMTTVRLGVATLLGKLDEVKLKPPDHSYPRGDVFEQLDLCIKKLDRLLRNLDKHTGSAEVDVPSIQARIACPDLQDFIESQLTADNVRVKVDASENQLSEFDFDGQENEVLSRMDIKRMGQRLIDSKQKPKKKKGKKK